MKIAISAAAEAELRAIEAFIAQDDPVAAARVSDDLLYACETLSRAPDRGAHIATRGGVKIRRLVVSPYLIVYSVAAQTVRIHRIVHGARSPRVILQKLDLT